MSNPSAKVVGEILKMEKMISIKLIFPGCGK
jgi:hypothetical protein